MLRIWEKVSDGLIEFETAYLVVLWLFGVRWETKEIEIIMANIKNKE